MFVKAQLAADLLDEKIRDQHIPALGMNGNGIWIFHASPAPVERADEWHDKVDVTTKAFLGLTVGCARCHDHKYDAIYAKDYYQMASIFASSRFKAYPRVPKAVVDEYEKQNKVLEQEKRGADASSSTTPRISTRRCCSRRPKTYMLAAWKVGSQKKATVESVAEDAKLDPELLGALGRVPEEEARQLLLAQAVAGDGRRKGHGGGSQEARARSSIAKVADVNEKHLKLEGGRIEVTHQAQFKN